MHRLLIQQAIIDEVWVQAFADGRKALKDTRFNGDKIQLALLQKGLTFDEIEKWLAYLSIQEYVSLTADDHTRNPFYITLEEKGLEAKISNYFSEQYKDKCRENTRTYVQIASQGILGLIGLIAFLITTGKSCTTHTTQPQQGQAVTIYTKTIDVKLDSNLRVARQDFLAEKINDSTKQDTPITPPKLTNK